MKIWTLILGKRLHLHFFYSEADPANLYKALIGVAIVAVVTFVGVMFTKWEYREDDEASAPPTMSLFKKK